MIVDVPNARYDLFNPDKTSHLRDNWNNNLKVVLNRSSFDRIVKILELNTGNKINFVVERLNVKFLKKHFDEIQFIFSTVLN